MISYKLQLYAGVDFCIPILKDWGEGILKGWSFFRHLCCSFMQMWAFSFRFWRTEVKESCRNVPFQAFVLQQLQVLALSSDSEEQWVKESWWNLPFRDICIQLSWLKQILLETKIFPFGEVWSRRISTNKEVYLCTMKTLYDGWQSNEWINSLFHFKNYEVDNVLSEWKMTHQNIHLFSIWEISFMWELTSQLIFYFSLRGWAFLAWIRSLKLGLPFLPWVSFEVLESWSLSFLKMSWDPTIVDWGVMGKNYIKSWCEPLKGEEKG